MITKTHDAGFTNNRNVGKYVGVAFSTVVRNEKGREEQVRVKMKAHYFEAGQGKVVLLLHGAAQSAYIYKRNFHVLAEQYRVIMPDLPGHGYSGCPDMDYTTDDFSLFIEAFANALSIDKMSIVAYGQSAVYALDFCYYNPRRVDKFVFINPGALQNTHFAGARFLRYSLGLFIVNRYARYTYMKKQLGKGFFDRTVLYGTDIAEMCRPFKSPAVRFAVRLSVANFFAGELLDKLPRIKVKTLFVEGTDDTLSNKRDTQLFLDGIDDAYEMKVRNCGAFPMFEKPHLTNKGILQFLAAPGTRDGE